MIGRFPLGCKKCRHFRDHNTTSNDPTYECTVNSESINRSETPLWSMDCPLGKFSGTELKNAWAEFLDAAGIYKLWYWIDRKVEKLSDWWTKK